MKVIILAETAADGHRHRHAARLGHGEAVVVSSSRSLDGVQLHDEDLIVELPGFRQRADMIEICDMLSRMMRRSGGEVPRWERITGR